MRPIAEVLGDAEIVKMAAIAESCARLESAVRGCLPEWIDPEGIAARILPEGVLEISAPAAQGRMLRQLLPVFTLRLHRFGVRRTKLMRT